MIHFSRFILDNGLKVLVHQDKSTPMAAVNLLYNVGARDESPDKTGFAHLFEHLMFSGSAHVPDFDEPVQRAGGDSNAFTNSDVTNFYTILPAENIETAFWLESDRMSSLLITAQSLRIQQKVVVEEFKESCLNQPYGDVWHHIAELAYKVHPYRWPTIGMVPQHVERATLGEVEAFYQKFYRPNNAILVVASPLDVQKVRQLVEHWFADIPAGAVPQRQLPQEPPQRELQQRINEAHVPLDALYLAFHIPARTDRQYYVADIISDILGNGHSSRLYRRLLKEQELFTQIDAYVTGSIDPGLLIVEGKPAEGISLQRAEAAIWAELELLKASPVEEVELQKYKNKLESTLVFSEANILNKAINLAFFEVLGNADLINEEVNYYQRIKPQEVYNQANCILTSANCSELYYHARPGLS